MRWVNERATTSWVATLLGRGSGVEMGSIHPGRLYVGEIIDGTRTELFELGERVLQYGHGRWTCHPIGPFRERES